MYGPLNRIILWYSVITIQGQTLSDLPLPASWGILAGLQPSCHHVQISRVCKLTESCVHPSLTSPAPFIGHIYCRIYQGAPDNRSPAIGWPPSCDRDQLGAPATIVRKLEGWGQGKWGGGCMCVVGRSDRVDNQPEHRAQDPRWPSG